MGGLDAQSSVSIDYRQHAGNQIGSRHETLLHRLKRLDLLSVDGRRRMRQRLAVLDLTVQRHGVPLAPVCWTGLPALCWRMAASRASIYQGANVEWRWIAHDLPRLIGRLVAASWSGAGWRGPCAAVHGAWSGLRRRPLPA